MSTYEQAYNDGQQARFDFSGDYTGGCIVPEFVIRVAGTQAGFSQLNAAQQSDYISAFMSGWAAGPKDTVRDQVLVQATTVTTPPNTNH